MLLELSVSMQSTRMTLSISTSSGNRAPITEDVITARRRSSSGAFHHFGFACAKRNRRMFLMLAELFSSA